MGTLAQLHEDIITTLSGVAGLVRSPVPFDANNLSDTLSSSQTKQAFVISLQSTDAGTERQATLLRVEHALSVQFLSRMQQMTQWASTAQQALDTEQRVIAALLTNTSLPGIRVRYLGTQREAVGAGVYLLTSMAFSLAHTYATDRVN